MYTGKSGRKLNILESGHKRAADFLLLMENAACAGTYRARANAANAFILARGPTKLS